MSPIAKTWEESACSPEEIVKSYGAVAILTLKINRVAVEHRQEAASACWHALQCINNIYARLGDIVDSVWIERDRFVVIHIKDSEELKATGRIVIGPSADMPTVSSVRSLRTWGTARVIWGCCFSRSVTMLKHSSPSAGPVRRRTRGLTKMRSAICEPSLANGFSASTRRDDGTPLGLKRGEGG